MTYEKDVETMEDTKLAACLEEAFYYNERLYLTGTFDEENYEGAIKELIPIIETEKPKKIILGFPKKILLCNLFDYTFEKFSKLYI